MNSTDLSIYLSIYLNIQKQGIQKMVLYIVEFY